MAKTESDKESESILDEQQACLLLNDWGLKMTLPVDHIYNLDGYITNEGEAFESVAESDLVSMDLWVPSESVAMHLIDPPSRQSASGRS